MGSAPPPGADARPSTAGPLSIRLLGGLEVRRADRVLIDASWPRRKAQSLIKLLALQPERSLHRERVFDFLWPEMSSEGATNNLHQTLRQIRQALNGEGAEAIALRAESVVLASDIALDIDAFRALARQSHADPHNAALCDDALALYQGDLLPDDLYEEWTVAPRQQLRDLRDELLLNCCRLHEEAGRLSQAEEGLQKLLAAEPAHEEAHRRLMRIYARSGKRERALRQYQLCEAALRDHLDADPSEETRTLLRTIQTGDVSPLPAPAPALTPSVGPGRRLPRRPPPWAIAAAFVLAAAGIAAAAIVALRSDTSAGDVLRVSFQHSGTATGTFEGDCTTEDAHGHASYTGTVQGDIVGAVTGEGDGTYYAAESCRSGSATVAFAITDASGNTLYFREEATPLTTIQTGPGRPVTVITDDPQTSEVVEGGTGVYQGAAGSGSCHSHSEAEFASGDTSFSAQWTYDCTLEIQLTSTPSEGAGGRVLRYSHAGRSVGTIVGDCITTNVKAAGDYDGEATGDLTGTIEGGGEGNFYAATQCQTGDLLVTYTITNAAGDELYVTETFNGAAETGFAASGETITVKANLPNTQQTITGGTNAFEDASGQGSCELRTTGELTPGAIDYESFWQADCTLTLVLPGAE